jgi:hypothetical protein
MIKKDYARAKRFHVCRNFSAFCRLQKNFKQMKTRVLFHLFMVVFGLGQMQAQRNVVINDVKLNETVLYQLEMTYQTQIPDGNYWYDKASGAWGYVNGPTQGVIPANMNIGGRLKANASGRGAGVYVNGREVHSSEVPFFKALFGNYYKNRYWMDAYGNLGLEGSYGLVNVYQVLKQYRQQNGGSYYRSNGNLDHYSGGDSSGFYIMGKDWSYSSF